MPNVTSQSLMFIPRRRRIGGAGSTTQLLGPTTNPNPSPVWHGQGADPSILVRYPDPDSPPQPAHFAFWSVLGSSDGEYTVRPDNPTNSIDVNLDPVTAMTATAWYLFAGGGGGNGGPAELETDAFLVEQNSFVEPTPIESVTPVDAWDPSDAREFVFTAESAEIEAQDSVVDPDEHFERWYALEGGATPGPGRALRVPEGDSGIAVATYRVPPGTSWKLPREPELVATIVGGVARDGNGGAIIGGHYHPIEPWSPFLAGLSVFSAARSFRPEERAALQREAMRAIAAEAAHVEREIKREARDGESRE